MKNTQARTLVLVGALAFSTVASATCPAIEDICNYFQPKPVGYTEQAWNVIKNNKGKVIAGTAAAGALAAMYIALQQDSVQMYLLELMDQYGLLPEEPVEPEEPQIYPIDPIDPDEPEIDPIDPDEPVVPEEPTIQPVDPVQPENPVLPVEPVVDPAQPVVPADPVQPVAPVDPVPAA